MKKAQQSANLTWTTIKRKINDLIPYQKNPRKMTEEQVEQLQTSLEKFGLVEIPAIDFDNTLLAGHQRMKVMQMLGKGEEEIDVRIPNRKLTESEFKEYLVRSNQNRGMFDFDLLGSLFDQQELIDIGFSPRELDMYDFSELDDVAITNETEEFENKTYELVFSSKEDYLEFVSALNDIQKNYYPESSLSDGLLKFVKNATKKES